LTVECVKAPSPEEIDRVQHEANGMIARDLPVEMFEMDRSEAERTFGPIIYDRFPVPDHVKVLTITRIEGWNINCCKGPHLPTTGSLGSIVVRKWRFRGSRNELELSFEVDEKENYK